MNDFNENKAVSYRVKGCVLTLLIVIALLAVGVFFLFRYLPVYLSKELFREDSVIFRSNPELQRDIRGTVDAIFNGLQEAGLPPETITVLVEKIDRKTASAFIDKLDENAADPAAHIASLFYDIWHDSSIPIKELMQEFEPIDQNEYRELVQNLKENKGEFLNLITFTKPMMLDVLEEYRKSREE